MYRVTWKKSPDEFEYSRDFDGRTEMNRFYDELYRDVTVNSACKYELVAIGSFSR